VVRVVPGAVGIDEQQVLGSVAQDPQAQRLARRRRTDLEDHLGRVVGGEGFVAQEEVRGGDDGRTGDVGAAAQLRGGVGENRPARRAAEARHRGGECDVRVEGPARDDAARVAADEVGECSDGVGVRSANGLDDGGVGAAGAPRGREGLALAEIRRHVARDLRRLERLAEREVQVDRAGRTPARRGHRPARQRARVTQGAPAGFGQCRLGEPANVVAVEVRLVDGLPRAPLAQLRRSIGGEQQQRDARVVGLDDRGEEVRRRGARGAHQGHRRPLRLGEPQGEEARRAFVDVGPAAQRRLVGRGHGERRRAGSRAQADVAHARARQLVEERSGEGVRPVGCIRDTGAHLRSPAAGPAWRAA
jgi:hypothetical protein